MKFMTTLENTMRTKPLKPSSHQPPTYPTNPVLVTILLAHLIGSLGNIFLTVFSTPFFT
jgi:hypothetical protein